MRKVIWRAASAVAVFAVVALPAFTQTNNQTPNDAFLVGYAANLAVGFSNINITNTGGSGGTEPAGDICANVYVFAEDQQLIACCACGLTPNHLQSISAVDLISNTLTPGVPTGITVALLATANPTNTTCDPASVTSSSTVWGMRAWGTVVHAAPGGGYTVTENEFSKAKLSLTELDKMATLCSYIEADGSFYGMCKSCTPGALGAKRQ